jgi:hypothetical protein
LDNKQFGGNVIPKLKMKKSHLIQELEAVKNAKRIYRDKAASYVLDHPEDLSELTNLVFDIKSPLHIKAAWVLELVCIENISLMGPHATGFLKNIQHVVHESALRPVSKVCYFISKSHFSDNKKYFELNKESVDQIIECNFDWLIEEHKVATQVFAMDTLQLWGKQYKWVQEELKLILQKKTNSGSKGYQAHARQLLKNL